MDKEQLQRFDQYNASQIQIGRTAIPALILINTAPFLATLNKITEIAQTPSLQPLTVAASWWGIGAGFGILIWLFSYLNALCVTENIKRPDRKIAFYGVTTFLWLAVLAGIGSVIAFGLGFGLGIGQFARIAPIGL